MRIPARLLLFSLCAALFALACSRGATENPDPNNGGIGHDPAVVDTTAPVLNITAPAANQLFHSGQQINVAGTITDDLGLYRGSIRITNDATGALLKEQLYEVHYILSYNFNIDYLATVSTPSNYTITVSFMDHGLNTTTRSVSVRVDP